MHRGLGAAFDRDTRYKPAATFDEIAKAIGTTRGGAWMLYGSAMKKLRRRKIAFRHLLALAHEAQRLREAKEVYED